MLKILMFLINLAILNSQHHILNIEEGDNKASKYLDAIDIKRYHNKSVSISSPHMYVKANEIHSDIFEPKLNSFNPDYLPNILVQKLNVMKHDPVSFNVNKCDTCLFFNYIDHVTPADPSINCDLSFPGREYDIKSVNEDDKYRADKIFGFKDFNIVFKKGKLFFAQYEGDTFSTYTDVGSLIHELKDKTFIDALAYEYGGIFFTYRIVYILCHTETEIFVFSIKGENNGFTLEQNVDKVKMGLKYKSISSFFYDLYNKRDILTIAYTNEKIALVIIEKGKVDKRQIIDDKKNPYTITMQSFLPISPLFTELQNFISLSNNKVYMSMI
jgi:hypothetical protein